VLTPVHAPSAQAITMLHEQQRLQSGVKVQREQQPGVLIDVGNAKFNSKVWHEA